MIRAEAHSDDHRIEVEFDATLWFEQADIQEILDLAKCEWGGHYAADQVALELADGHRELTRLFDYLNIVNDVGFEVHVDEDNARAWLLINHPGLLGL